MQILSKVSSAVAVNLSVIPPDCDQDGDEAEETHSGRLEQTAEAFRFPGTVIAGTAWRLELSCRLFAFRNSKSCVFTSRKTEKYGENFESVHKVSMAFVAKK